MQPLDIANLHLRKAESGIRESGFPIPGARLAGSAQDSARTIRSKKANPRETNPISPTKGSALAVLGNAAGGWSTRGSSIRAGSTGAGCASTGAGAGGCCSTAAGSADGSSGAGSAWASCTCCSWVTVGTSSLVVAAISSGLSLRVSEFLTKVITRVKPGAKRLGSICRRFPETELAITARFQAVIGNR